MHKLRNTKHKEILERVLNIVPTGFEESPFSKMKKRTRMFCASCEWNENKIREYIESGDWIYSWVFFSED